MNNVNQLIRRAQTVSTVWDPTKPRNVTGGQLLNTLLDASAANTVYADGAVQLTAACKHYLSCPSNSTLQTGDIDFEVGCWVYLDVVGASQGFIAKDTSTTAREFLLYTTGTNIASFRVTNDGTTATTIASTAGALTTNTWYFIRGWHDSINNTLNISVNGVVNSVSYSSGVYIGTAPLLFGIVGDGTSRFSGRIDSAYFTKRISTSTEVTALYNSGNARHSTECTAANGLDVFWTNVISWYDMSEENGIRFDSKGSNHLSCVYDPIIDSASTLGSELIVNGSFEDVLTQKVVNGTFDVGETLGSEIILNGGFETLGPGGADVFATWEEYNDTGTFTASVDNPHSGSVHAQLTRISSSGLALYQGFSCLAATRYKLTFWTKGNDGVAASYYIYAENGTGGTFANATTGVSAATYTLVTVYFTTPADCTLCRVGFWSPMSTNGTAYFDDVSVKQVLVTDTNGWTASVALLAVVADGQSGNCLRITNTVTNNGNAYQSIPTVAGGRYTFTCYLKQGTSTTYVRFISNGGAGSIISVSSYGYASWTLLTLSFTALDTATLIEIGNQSGSAGAMSYVDSVSVTYAGWTSASGAVLASVAGGQSGNCLQVTNTTQGWAYQAITTVVNQNYTLSYYHKSGTASGVVMVGEQAHGGPYVPMLNLADATWVQKSHNFKALTTTTYIALWNNSSDAGTTTLYDSVSVKALTQTNLNGGFESLGTGETLGSELLTNGGFETLGAGETLGSELVVNGGFETAGAGGADVFAGWIEAAGAGTITDELVSVNSGSHALMMTKGADTNYVYQNYTVVASTYYKLTFWTRGDGTNAGGYDVYNYTGSSYIFSTVTTGVTGTGYAQVTRYFRTPAGCVSIRLALYTANVLASSAYFDDISLKSLDVADVFANWNENFNTGFISAETSSKYAGTYAAKVIATDYNLNACIYYNKSGLTASTRYKLTFWTRGDGTNAGLYRLFNISGSSDILANVTTGITGTNYTQVTQYFTTPVGCTAIGIYLLAIGSPGSAYFDDVSLKQVTAYDIFANWGSWLPDRTTINVDWSIVYAGTNALRFDHTNTTSGSNVFLSGYVSNNMKYKAIAYAKASSVGPNITLGNGTAVALTTSYAAYTSYFLGGGNMNFYISSSGTVLNKSVYVDSVSLYSAEIPSAPGIAKNVAVNTNLAASFNGSSQYLYKNSNASLQIGDVDFTVWGWVNFVTVPTGDSFIIAKYHSAGNREYGLMYYAGSAKLVFVCSNDGTNGTICEDLLTGTPVPNMWYFIVGWHDSVNNKLWISTNNNTPQSVPYSIGVTARAGAFSIGSRGDGSLLLPGRATNLGLIKRLLTSDEITTLFTCGRSVHYSLVPSTIRADSTHSYWPLSEYSNSSGLVTRSDLGPNANHLTDVGNTPSGYGVNYNEGVVSKYIESAGGKIFVQGSIASRLLFKLAQQNGKPAFVGDGLTKHISYPSDIIGIGDVTIYVTVKALSWGGNGYARIFSNAQFEIDTPSPIQVTSNNSTLASSGTISLGTNYVIVITRSSAGTVNFYINDVLSGTANQSSGTPAVGGATYIGNRAALDRGFDGLIYEIGKYDGILSPAQISALTAKQRAKWGV